MDMFKYIFIIFLSSSSYAGTMEYFDSKINFWNDSVPNKETIKSAPVVSEKQNSKFPWKVFQDPKNKEFFKEGDYTPPEPFMEVARNPTDENIKEWFDLMQKKNELQSKLQVRMQEYMAKNGNRQALQIPAIGTTSAENIEVVTKTKTKSKAVVVPLDPSRFRVRMYFESTCPHCKRMFEVLNQLKNDGFYVEALQVDSGPVPDSEKIVPIGKADPIELKKHGIKGVPYILIADTKRKALLPAIEGYHDFSEIMQLLRAVN